jgi:predicted RNase H-related nuclease YkuK (DUF458 family)
MAVDLSKNGYHSPSKGSVTIGKMIDEITSFVTEEPNEYYRLVIGSDSQAKVVAGKHQIDFVTAIVVYRIGNGARYFWKKDKINKKPILRDKIYTETMKSLETAQELVPELTKAMGEVKYDLEIHIDVGQVGKTREMIKEVVGMVTGSGYVAKTKPDSWAASSVADKHT